jgi:hypothetical protein
MLPRVISSTIRRLVLLAGSLVLCLLAIVGPATAEPAELPVFDGVMTFPMIHGPTDPEDYSWQVRVLEEQELILIDDQHAEVVYEDGHRAFLITAEPAHDAEGKAVPTSIAISGENVLTLTVHHSAGNPAAGGTPFRYPVVAGTPYDTGYSTVYEIEMPPAKRADPPAPTCVVPGLRGWKLKASRTWLRQALCALGKVRGERRSGAKVVKQSPAPGPVLPAGARVAVKLGL